jgi:signal transduction histidine kinase/CheY-like chemotaxis protein
MRAPETPANEEARLGALRAYDVLDTAEEASFDALTKLAAGIVGTPIALVSLVDERRQWFKSRYGLSATETPREVSFCGHVVADEAPVVVPDAHQDVRFAGNPLVTGELRNFEGGTSHLRQIRDALHEARSGTERIRKIVRGLQSLSREESPPVPTEVSDPVEVAINLASHEIRHRASIVKRLSSTPRILADDARLAQALVSLLVNAGQAFESNDVQRNLVVVGSELRSDGRVAISVSDNGPGIAPELQKRVFDPFFSTKEVGKGSGLGLSIAQSVVTAMGGELQLTSAVGKGSTFRILLPAAPPVKPPEPVAETRPEEARRGRVLAIDDEPIILRTITRVLEKEHEVTALEDSRKALELLRGGATFDVIFCDLMMPDLPGNQLYAQVKAARPELAERFVFVSGGVTQPEMVQFLEDIPNERLEKPFSVQNLRGIARRFLEPAKAAP